MSKTHRVGLALVLTLTLPGLALAEDDAQAWIEKMAARTQQGHYKVRINADMNVNQQGMQSSMKMNGTANFANSEMFRVTLEMAMTMGGAPMTINMLSVADGESFWIEMDSPMMGGTRVLKGAVADLDKVAEMSGGAGVGGVGSNPVEEIHAIVERFDMTLRGKADGRVVLHADIDPSQAGGLDNFGPLAASMTQLDLELDEQTAMPVKMTLGGEQPVITMNFADYEFFKPEATQASDYAYAPPEGVQVQDVTGMVSP